MIETILYDKQRPDSTYDVKRKKWVSHRIDIRAGGKRYRNRFATKRAAQDFIDDLKLKKRRQRAGLQTSSLYRITELFRKRLARLSNKEAIRAKRVFQLFVDLNGDLIITDVEKSHFQEFVNRRLDDGVKPATVNREVTVLSSCFRGASEIFADVSFSPNVARAKYKKRRAIRRTISDAEKDKIVLSILNDRLKKEHLVRTNSRKDFARMFEVAWMLGLRYSEIKDFTPETDLHGETLIIRRGKTDTLTQWEPLPARAIELLSQGRFEIECSDHTLNDILKQACEANGVKYGRGGLDSVTFHSTRHSFTTRLVQVTDIATAAAFTGHSDKEMVVYYSHASDESKRLAMERMYGSTDIKDVFERVRDGKMSIEEFARLVTISPRK